MKRALVIGSNGTIGAAITENLSYRYDVVKISRVDCDYSESSLSALAEQFKQQGSFELIVCCVGVLHNDMVSPEKRLAQLDAHRLAEYFRINTIIPALCLRFFAPLLSKKPDGPASRFVFLSAMVGSIGDNSLGGWYGYRSSKAALNMMVKTASVEIARTHKKSALAVVHPGTTRGPLSKPFSGGVKKENYYTPEQSAERIIQVAESIQPSDSGSFLNWDGSSIPW